MQSSTTDHETGESVLYPMHLPHQQQQLSDQPVQPIGGRRFDAETGEPEYDHTFEATGDSVSACAAAQPIRKIPGFNVPRELLQTQEPAAADVRCGIDGNENYSLFPKVQVLTLQEVSFVLYI